MRLLRYNTEINTFRVDDALAIFSSSFDLSEEESEEIKGLLEFYYNAFSRGYGLTKNYWTIKDDLKAIKDLCQEDWSHWMKDEMDAISPLHAHIFRTIKNSHRPRQLQDNICHTCLRIGEFFYVTDEEMEKLSEDMESFIDSGDCKLFDEAGSPYGSLLLRDTLEEDIKEKADQIAEYIRSKNSSDLVVIDPDKILDALKTIRGWVLGDISDCPDWARGYIQVCQEIKKNIARSRKDFEDLRNEGIKQEWMMKKRSGFCLNKEKWFRNFLNKTKMVSWKNPEGSWIVGSSRLPIPSGVYKETLLVKDWDMDCIYYSLGKGPWLKTRYVGQPCSFFQNIAELGASIIKRTIKSHEAKRMEAMDRGEETELEDASGLNIYDNYDPLMQMISVMDDSIAMDFSSYSDYLSRNTFRWIMQYLWGFPTWYTNIIMGMMALPIKVNGKTYEHKHGSVMGIKLNFLLITFANMVMWMVGNIISGCEDRAKFMGDDRITTKTYGYYTDEEFSISLSVTAYFNCVVNPDKTEWLKRDGYTSFCKRTFNREGEQISGLGGEYLLKQKPFLNDVAVWENVCWYNDIPLTPDQVKKWIIYWAPYFRITYNKFLKETDPKLEDMVQTLLKIPFCYGGWSLEETTEEMDQIMLRSVMSTVNIIMSEVQEDRSSPSINRIREYLRVNAGPENRYYLNMLNTSSYTMDFDRIRNYVEDVVRVLSRPSNTLEDMRRARGASQRLMEIILDRDSRLASSTSTKNRIDYSFDQDRVSKIRTKYVQATFEETEHQIKSGLIDQAVLQDCLESRGVIGIQDYLKYLECKTISGVTTCYYGGYGKNYYGMKVIREHPDGSGSTYFWKRLSASDSDYRHIYEEDGRYKGLFVNWDDLTDPEKVVYRMLGNGRTRKIVEQLDRIVENNLKDMKTFILSYLADRYTELLS